MAVSLGHGFAGSDQQSVDLDVLQGEKRGMTLTGVEVLGAPVTSTDPAVAVDK